MAAKIRKGDKVIVLAGRDKGKSGEVTLVFPTERRAVVAGVNVVKRHTRQSAKSEGGILSKEAPIDMSNLAIADPKTGKPTRVGFKTLDDGRKVTAVPYYAWDHRAPGEMIVWPRQDGKATDVDLKHCKGCGICAKECPESAIAMKSEEKE